MKCGELSYAILDDSSGMPRCGDLGHLGTALETAGFETWPNMSELRAGRTFRLYVDRPDKLIRGDLASSSRRNGCIVKLPGDTFFSLTVPHENDELDSFARNYEPVAQVAGE